ncbi:hypothetical protein APHAL10511_002823 [Amanita phalloides]|nr:hypothetical protein APHAL10511_002823 [Amanita phalloides]
MAFAQPMPRISTRDPSHTAPLPQIHRRHAPKQRFIADLSQCLFDFVIQLLPTQEEMAVKEDVRKLLERLIRTIEPDSRLLSFGSTANGFSLRNSDMDLCCLIDSDERLAATDLVTMLGDLLERETKFHVKPLPLARIPIVKLSLDPSPGLPLGIACDIGFENRLALENTRLLMCYAMVDPTRVRTLVLFLKVWSKRRKINSPYRGTLSSYGYVLLVIYFLVHVKNPPVLPNLQQMPPLRPITKEETHVNGYNTWFFDDIDLLRQRWRSDNTDSVGELLIDFFRYYSRDFLYNTGVASIRSGLLKKEIKGWQNDLSAGRYNDVRERNRLCIEDPFEIDYNVARCVTKDGLYTIRGEFMRASRILSTRPERAWLALAELCEERKVEELVSPPLAAPRLSNPPPQTPFPVGSQSMRANTAEAPDNLSPTSQPSDHGSESSAPHVAERPVPEHMAPKRGKWTSPPPPEAPSVDHALFDAQLGKSLELATASTEARQQESHNSSSSNSETYTDEDQSDAAESDDITSVRSFTEGTNMENISGPTPLRRPSWHLPDTAIRIPQINVRDESVMPLEMLPSQPPHYSALVGSRNQRPLDKVLDIATAMRLQWDAQLSSSLRPDANKRRQIPGFSRNMQRTPASQSPILTSSISSSPASIPLPASPDLLSSIDSAADTSATVYYQTTRSPRPTSVLYPGSSSGSQQHLSPQHNAFLSQYHQQQAHTFYLNNVPQDIFPSNMPPAITSTTNGCSTGVAFNRGFQRHVVEMGRMSSNGTPKPTLQDRHSPHLNHNHTHTHAHSNSSTTVTAPNPPPVINPAAMRFSVQVRNNSPLMRAVDIHSSSSSRPSSSRSMSSSPQIHSNSPAASQVQIPIVHTPVRSSSTSNGKSDLTSPQPSTSTISNESSPALSTGTGYESSVSRSPSPHSPRSPPPAVPIDRVMQFLARVGKREGGEGREGAVFGSFAALENPHVLQNLNRHHPPRHAHHRRLVTADPAVLEVSPPVPTTSCPRLHNDTV